MTEGKGSLDGNSIVFNQYLWLNKPLSWDIYFKNWCIGGNVMNFDEAAELCKIPGPDALLLALKYGT